MAKFEDVVAQQARTEREQMENRYLHKMTPMLFKQGCIDLDEYEKYLLSTDSNYFPPLNKKTKYNIGIAWNTTK